MSDNKSSIWHYVSLLPFIIALTNVCILSLIFSFNLILDPKLFIIVVFAMAELTMIVAGLGGIAYLLNADSSTLSKRLLGINISLFFLSALLGMILFLNI